MQIIDCEQGTDEWFSAKLGVASASDFSKIMAKGSGATRGKYLMQLVAEELTRESNESFTSAAMAWGIKQEPKARQAYEMITDKEVDRVGFCKLSDRIGASPDGLVGEDGMLEIKCPDTATHLETILSDNLPNEHKAQIQGQLWVCGRIWCDFVSYDPRIKNSSGFFKIRVERDDNYIRSSLIPEVNKFVADLEKTIKLIEDTFICFFCF